MPEHDVRFAQHESRIAQVEKRLDSHDRDLYGNGKPGLKTIVDRLEQKDMGHSKGVVISTGAIAAVIGGVIQLVAMWLKS